MSGHRFPAPVDAELQEYREVGDRTWEPVPGTVEAEDVAEAARRYGDGDAPGRRTFGVLLDLRVT